MFPDFEPEEILPERDNQPYRVLPPGLHETTLAEIKEELVDCFIESRTRPDSFARYSQLHADAVAHNILFCQWIGGSFTTSKSDPGDIRPLA